MLSDMVLDSPQVSVIVPAHNVGLWIGDCINSILDEDEVSIEVIVIDDGSDDETDEVVSEIADRDSRVRLVRATGAGGAQARDLGVELARGEYIAFADGDDLVPAGAYSAMLNSARRSGSDLVVGRFFKFFLNRTWHPTRRWAAFAEPRQAVSLADHPSLINNRACWNRLFRREWWIDEGITFPSVPRSNDIVPMTKALTRARSIDVVTDNVYLYRDRPGTTSMTSQAGVGEGVESYLAQEFECRALIEAVGSEELLSAYDDLFAAQDGWQHLLKFLTAGRYRRTETARLGRIQQWSQRMALVQREHELPRTRWEIRWAWVLMAEGRWDDAALIAKTLAIPARTRRWPDPEFWLEQVQQIADSPYLPEGLAARVLEEQLLHPIATKAVLPTIERSWALSAAADFISRTFAIVDRRTLNASRQQVLLMLEQGEAGVPPRSIPKVTLRSVLHQDGLIHFTIDLTAPERLLHLRLDSPQGETHVLPAAPVGDKGHCSATVAVGDLGDVPLALFAVIDTPYGSVDYRLEVAVVTRIGEPGEELVVGTHERELWRVPTPARDHVEEGRWGNTRVTRAEVIPSQASEAEGDIADEQANAMVDELHLEVWAPSDIPLTALRLWTNAGGVAYSRHFRLKEQEPGSFLGVQRRDDLVFHNPRTVLGTLRLALGMLEVPLHIHEDGVTNSHPDYRIELRGETRLKLTRRIGALDAAAAGR